MSLGASGQLGKALVFFTWKGLNVVREFVVPSNPKTTGQNTQRGYLRACVAAIHRWMGQSSMQLQERDIVAYALWASVVQTATTWFNQICRMWLKQKVAGLIPCIFRGTYLETGDTTLKVRGRVEEESGAITNLQAAYGTSKTALIGKMAMTLAEFEAGKVITALTNGVKYYVQVQPLLPVTMLGSNSGIYYGTPSA